MQRIACLLVILTTVWAAAALAETLDAGAKVAFLGIHFTDMSTEGALNGAREDETRRVAISEEYIIRRLTEHGFDVLATDAIDAELEKYTNPARCNGCDLEFGKALGARYVVVSEVVKISNLIQSVNIAVRDVETGRQIKGMAVDIRGNTDAAWERGLRYILDRHVLID